jgi:hypothetical protein
MQGYKLRKLIGSGSNENTATVLSTGQQWELLRAAYWGHYQRHDIAEDANARAQGYALQLTEHLDRINK